MAVQNYTNRIYSPLVAGAKIYIARMGAKVGSGSNVVSPSAAPTAPTTAEPGPWISMGKIKTATTERTKKTVQVEGVNDSGTYDFEDINLAQTNKVKLTTQTVTPEAFELIFGVIDQLNDASPAQPFVSSGNIQCWLYVEVTNAGTDGTTLATMMVEGTLSLTNSPNFASDPVTMEMEHNVRSNSLNKVTTTGISTLASA